MTNAKIANIQARAQAIAKGETPPEPLENKTAADGIEEEIEGYLDESETTAEEQPQITHFPETGQVVKAEKKTIIRQTKSTVQSIVDMVHDESFLKRARDQLGEKTEQFMTSVLTLYNSNTDFKDCDPLVLYNVCLKAAALDLPFENNLGLAYILPYKDKHRKTAKYPSGGAPVPQLQIGWKGFVELAQRSGQYRIINVTDVREGEMGKRNRLTGEIEWNWINDDQDRLKRKVVGYVAFIELISGFRKSLYMSEEEVTAHGKKYSPQYRLKNSGMWKDQHDDMARKTVVKQLISKWGPKSTKMVTAIRLDQSDGNGYYPDNNDTPVFDVQEAELGDSES